MLNRKAILVRAKQPFLDWILSSPKPPCGVTLESLNAEPELYLLPDWIQRGDREDALRFCFKDIFAAQLAGWRLDESCWPRPRTFERFQDWFTVEYMGRITDLVNDEPLRND